MKRVNDRRVLSGIVRADCADVQYPCDRAVYRQRNIIERMFCRLKDWRRIATRYDRKLKSFMSAVALAAMLIWWL